MSHNASRFRCRSGLHCDTLTINFYVNMLSSNKTMYKVWKFIFTVGLAFIFVWIFLLETTGFEWRCSSVHGYNMCACKELRKYMIIVHIRKWIITSNPKRHLSYTIGLEGVLDYIFRYLKELISFWGVRGYLITCVNLSLCNDTISQYDDLNFLVLFNC